MKSEKELAIELCEQNIQTLLARKLDLRYHKDTLIPRYLKEKDKKVRKAKVENAEKEMEQLKVLIKDLQDIIKFNKEMIAQYK